MIGTKILAPVVAALLLVAAAAAAQPDGNEPATSIPAQQQPTPGKGGNAAQDAPAALTKPGDSPSDYRSSEQISEDLPVSFPVDI